MRRRPVGSGVSEPRNQRNRRRPARLMLMALFICSCAHRSGDAEAPLRSGKGGAVATANAHATRAALEILAQGGNALDAAIAAALVLGVTEPYSAGLGGGGFALFYEARTKSTRAIDFRERAPARAHRDMYLDPQGQATADSITGWLAPAVPGTAAGLHHLHGLGAEFSWRALVQPAQALAAKGFPITPLLQARIQRRLDDLVADPEMERIFAPGGNPPANGLLVQTDLADTLQRMAENGPKEWRSGLTVERIAKAMKDNDGLVSRADFENYRVKEREPIRGRFKDLEVLSFPPPSSGGIHLVQMLRMLESMGLPTAAGPEFRHRWIEIMRRAYQDRARHLGDPDFYQVPVAGLLAQDHLDALTGGIDKDQASPSKTLDNPQPAGRAPGPAAKGMEANPSPETSHLSVVDKDGNAVSLTFTINTTFGAAVMAPGTGVVLNNEMDDFSAKPGVPNAYGLIGGEANAIAPGKTPLSSMTPTLVFQGDRLRLVIGSPGGSTIITTVLQTILQTLHFQRPLTDSLALPHFHHQWLPDCVLLDRGGLQAELMAELKAKGHCLKVREDFGNAQGVLIEKDGRLFPASDPRGEGLGAVLP